MTPTAAPARTVTRTAVPPGRGTAASTLTAVLAAMAAVALPGGRLAAQTSKVVGGPNLRVASGEHNESWIAAISDNPDFLIAVTQTGEGVSPDSPLALSGRSNAAFVSRDGGISWEPVMLPGDESGAFDPWWFRALTAGCGSGTPTSARTHSTVRPPISRTAPMAP